MVHMEQVTFHSNTKVKMSFLSPRALKDRYDSDLNDRYHSSWSNTASLLSVNSWGGWEDCLISRPAERLRCCLDNSFDRAQCSRITSEVTWVGGLMTTTLLYLCWHVPPPTKWHYAPTHIHSWQLSGRTSLSCLFLAPGRSNISEDKQSLISVSHLLSACLHLWTGKPVRSHVLQHTGSSLMSVPSPLLHLSLSLSGALKTSDLFILLR